MNNWRKSSRSNSQGTCVEVADGVAVRDSTDQKGAVLRFRPGQWDRFLNRVKSST